MIRTLTKGTPLTIVRQQLEPQGFAIDTKNGPRLSHMKMVLTDKFDRLLSIEYNESDRPVFDPVWTHIVTARAAGAIGVDAPSVQGSRVERSREGTRKLGPRRDKSRRLVTSSA
jgi:hypothetical protein